MLAQVSSLPLVYQFGSMSDDNASSQDTVRYDEDTVADDDDEPQEQQQTGDDGADDADGAGDVIAPALPPVSLPCSADGADDAGNHHDDHDDNVSDYSNNSNQINGGLHDHGPTETIEVYGTSHHSHSHSHLYGQYYVTHNYGLCHRCCPHRGNESGSSSSGSGRPHPPPPPQPPSHGPGKKPKLQEQIDTDVDDNEKWLQQLLLEQAESLKKHKGQQQKRFKHLRPENIEIDIDADDDDDEDQDA